jgi:3-oxoacyl-[acyl-carrier protein] reductase
MCARHAETLEIAAQEIRSSTGAEIITGVVDVADELQVSDFTASVRKTFGSIDICVANAGGPPSKAFAETSPADWRAAVDLNLMSTVTFAREVLPGMCERRWGRFLAITSVSVKQPLEKMVLSNSIRSAVSGLVKTLSNECGPYGVLVNNICPGYTATARLLSIGLDENAISAQIPLRRLGTPEEFANVAVFLCSERASYVNGVTIPVDGGLVRGL